MDFKSVIESKDYDFLRNDPLLKDNILFLTVAGSHAYGTNIETSDIDIRGVVLESETDTLGLTDFEQYVDAKTDTVIYSLKKFLKLVRECNPNIIEMLYSKPEHYLYVSPVGKLLLENRDLFLTKRAAYSFGGYANAQLNRLENALARDKLPKHDKLEHVNRSILNATKAFEMNFNIPKDSIKTYVASYQESLDEEVLVDINLKHYPLTKLKGMIDYMNNVLREYDEKTVQRNQKKDDLHLNKHMMHLIRLYYMCNEILEYGTLHIYRDGEHEILLNIRNGKYRDSFGNVTKEFYILLDNLKEKCDKLKKETKLPDYVDKVKFNELVLMLYRKGRR